MSVSYLDVDDEITDAVARLRDAHDGKVVVVVPPGSRIASSRINFLLLAREAEGRRLVLAVVSGDPQVRAIALSAGVDSHASVTDAESALGLTPHDGAGTLVDAPAAPSAAVSAAPPAAAVRLSSGPRSGASPRTMADTEVVAASALAAPSTMPVPAAGPTAVAPPPPPPSVPQSPSQTAAMPTAYQVSPRAAGAVSGAAAVTDASHPLQAETRGAGRSRGRGRSRLGRGLGLVLRLAIVAAIVGGALYAAYLFVPTADVSITPTTQTYGPQTYPVVADPAVAVPDAKNGLVPAQHVPIPLSAEDMFPATGTDVNLSPATGSVRFTSENTLFQVPIPEGTQVSTASDVVFQTTKSVTLPQANFQQGPTTADVPIRAVKPGESGNVPSGSISVLPKPIAAQLVKVTNPDKTTGGKRTDVVVVTEGDYQKAVAALTQQLQDQLAAAVGDPNTVPIGLTLYGDTAALGKVEPDQAESEVVGAHSMQFQLSAQTIASALAVDEALVGQVASDRLAATVPGGTRLFPETITTQVTPGMVSDGRVSYQVSAEGQAYTPVSASDLAQKIRGKTVSDAQSILGGYGDVVISVWPDFIPTIPDDVRRIDVTVEDPRLPQ